MEIIKRTSCRAVLLTSDSKILLIKVENPDGGWIGWITPGGGIAPGEDEETALKRELCEELGLVNVNIGPKVWTRFHAFPYRGKIIEQQEFYFLVKSNQFEPKSKMNLNDSEMVDHRGFRWWDLEEIGKSKENFAPRRLYSLLQDLNKIGPPTFPVDAGI